MCMLFILYFTGYIYIGILLIMNKPVNMYHMSAQGVDERMINVLYLLYCLCVS